MLSTANEYQISALTSQNDALEERNFSNLVASMTRDEFSLACLLAYFELCEKYQISSENRHHSAS